MIPEQQQEANKAKKTLRASSSCVHKIINVQGDKTWSASMFLDEEFLEGPGGTTHNTSSSIVS